MGQQFYVIRNNPAPGTPAAAAKLERDRAKAAKKGIVLPEDLEAQRLAEEAEARREEQKRVQPKRQPRSQRSGGQKPNPQKAGPKQAQRNKPKPKKR
jgi:YidC/Oxa1 family membrane protein insertase